MNSTSDGARDGKLNSRISGGTRRLLSVGLSINWFTFVSGLCVFSVGLAD
jgi:hypothetical protein